MVLQLDSQAGALRGSLSWPLHQGPPEKLQSHKKEQQNRELGCDPVHDFRPTFPDPEHGARHVAICLELVMKSPLPQGPDWGGGLSDLSCTRHLTGLELLLGSPRVWQEVRTPHQEAAPVPVTVP